MTGTRLKLDKASHTPAHTHTHPRPSQMSIKSCGIWRSISAVTSSLGGCLVRLPSHLSGVQLSHRGRGPHPFYVSTGDERKTSDDISLTLVENCSHYHGKHAAFTCTPARHGSALFGRCPFLAFRSAPGHQDVLPGPQRLLRLSAALDLAVSLRAVQGARRAV